MASSKVFKNITKNQNVYYSVLLLILIALVFNYNREGYQDFSIDKLKLVGVDGARGDTGKQGRTGKVGDEGDPGDHGDSAVDLLSNDVRTLYTLGDSNKDEEIANGFINYIAGKVIEKLNKDDQSLECFKNTIFQRVTNSVYQPTTQVVTESTTTQAIVFPKVKYGTIIAWHMSDNIGPPGNGWQLCDGAFLRFPGGNTVPNGPKVPDLRGRFILGGGGDGDQADGDTFSTTGEGKRIQADYTPSTLNEKFNKFQSGSEEVYGSTFHKLTINEVPPHDHNYHRGMPIRWYSWTWCNASMPDDQNAVQHSPFNLQGEVHEGHYTDSKGGDIKHNNMPPFYILEYYIKQPESQQEFDDF